MIRKRKHEPYYPRRDHLDLPQEKPVSQTQRLREITERENRRIFGAKRTPKVGDLAMESVQ